MTQPLQAFLIDAEPGPAVDLRVLLRRATILLGAAAASLALADTHHALRVVAATHEPAVRLQQSQIDLYDLYAASPPGGWIQADLRQATPYWPDCVAPAATAGYRRAAGIALHMDGATVGALNVFRAEEQALTPQELEQGTAVAALLTAALSQQRALHRVRQLAGQLQEALSSRVAIEQAKGILAERLQLDMTRAFGVLRKRARDGNLRLHDAARAVIDSSTQQTASIIDLSSPRLDRGPAQPQTRRTHQSSTGSGTSRA
jgi:GAF domain-containing protein